MSKARRAELTGIQFVSPAIPRFKACLPMGPARKGRVLFGKLDQLRLRATVGVGDIADGKHRALARDDALQDAAIEV
jgi:hypothetical protein